MKQRIWIRLGKSALVCVGLLLVLGLAGYFYAIGFRLEELPTADPQTQPADLVY